MDPAAVIDDLLEITVIGSFSRIGYDAAPPPVRLDRCRRPAPWPGGPSC